MNREALADFPSIEPSQYVVIHAEWATGIVLTLDGEYWIGDGECYIVCDSLEAAQQLGQATILANPLLECVIYSAEKIYVTTIRGPFPLAPSLPPKNHGGSSGAEIQPSIEAAMLLEHPASEPTSCLAPQILRGLFKDGRGLGKKIQDNCALGFIMASD